LWAELRANVFCTLVSTSADQPSRNQPFGFTLLRTPQSWVLERDETSILDATCHLVREFIKNINYVLTISIGRGAQKWDFELSEFRNFN
jgi:hypothetical protein